MTAGTDSRPELAPVFNDGSSRNGVLDPPGPEAELARQWAAFEQWAQNLPLNALECRVGQHRWPDWSDHRRTKIKRQVNGIFHIHVECMRKCGAYLTRYVNQDGYLTRANKIKHEYPKEKDGSPSVYLMPKEARSGHGFTAAQRAYLRAEIIERLSEWITDEEGETAAEILAAIEHDQE